MKFAILFFVLAVVLLSYGWYSGGWGLLLLWPALSFFLVATAYLVRQPFWFGKQLTGKIHWVPLLLLLPYYSLLWTLWHVLRWIKKEPPTAQLSDKLWFGRRLFHSEVPTGIELVIDLTCEFPKSALPASCSYRSLPLLDGVACTEMELEQVLNWIHESNNPVYLHCAEGHGRSGMIAAAWFLVSGQAVSVAEAITKVQQVRPLVRLRPGQVHFLERWWVNRMKS